MKGEPHLLMSLGEAWLKWVVSFPWINLPKFWLILSLEHHISQSQITIWSVFYLISPPFPLGLPWTLITAKPWINDNNNLEAFQFNVGSSIIHYSGPQTCGLHTPFHYWLLLPVQFTTILREKVKDPHIWSSNKRRGQAQEVRVSTLNSRRPEQPSCNARCNAGRNAKAGWLGDPHPKAWRKGQTLSLRFPLIYAESGNPTALEYIVWGASELSFIHELKYIPEGASVSIHQRNRRSYGWWLCRLQCRLYARSG